MNTRNYDCIIVGAGFAGVEAALSVARLGYSSLLITMNLNSIVNMACNPSIGGTAKGHLVREIDALGGEMGVTSDKCLIQLRMLNLGKGAAVHSLRAQIDKALYHQEFKKVLEQEDNVTLLEAEVNSIIVENGKVKGISCDFGNYYSSTVVVATGVYLNARIIIGEITKESGPTGFMRATKLSQNLMDIGLPIRRFKTGTPARVLKSSINFDKMQVQEGESTINKFSFLSEGYLYNQDPCYLTYTNEITHNIIRANIHRSPLYSGDIKGIGPRYCPSIEDKVMRFSDKERHQIFIEPEGRNTDEMYIQGLSSSLPYDVQLDIYHSIAGLENAQIMRYAYAIEYDCIDPTILDKSLQVKHIKGLYMAGQLNGSSGYEEAAAQGLIAGINSVQYIRGEEPLVLGRDQAYIGVLIDDLVTKGTNEPYRMMTARAEFRLSLRQGNADKRLTKLGYELGLASTERYDLMLKRYELIASYTKLMDTVSKPKEFGELFTRRGENHKNTGMKYSDIIKRQNINAIDLKENFELFSDCDMDILNECIVDIVYEGYMKRQNNALRELQALENRKLPENIDYLKIAGLRLEAREKLNRIRPATLGQASRISGVSPADVNVLIVRLFRS